MQPTTYTFNMNELEILIAVAKDVQQRLASDYDFRPNGRLFTEYSGIQEDFAEFLDKAKRLQRMMIGLKDDQETTELTIKSIVAAVLSRGTQGAGDNPVTRLRMSNNLPHTIDEYAMKRLHIKLHEPVRLLVNDIYRNH